MPHTLALLLLGLPAVIQDSDPLAAAAERAREAGGLLPVIVHVAAPDVDLHALRALRLARAADAELQDLVAQFEAQARQRQQPVAAQVEVLGGRVGTQFWIIMAFAAEIPPARLDELLALPGVAGVEPDLQLPPALHEVTDSAHHQVDSVYGILDPAGDPIDGRGQTVAIIDTGADGDMQGTGRPHRHYFVNGDPADTSGGGLSGSRLLSASGAAGNGTGEDEHGHGTTVASCAAGEDWLPGNGIDNRGVAPRAGIRSLKIAGASGTASTSTMAAAFQSLAGYGDVRVANMSFTGTPHEHEGLSKTIDRVVFFDDIVVTLAAGNDGDFQGRAHGSLNAVTVGAVNKSKSLAGFSTRGPLNGRLYPLMTATGQSVTAAARDNETGSIGATGTSFAAPITAGAVALIRQAAPERNALEVRALLFWGLSDEAAGDPDGIGLGYLRAEPSVNAALAGDVRKVRLDAGGASESYEIHYDAGEAIRLVAVWHRQIARNLGRHEVRVTILNPDGSTLAVRGQDPELHADFRIDAQQTGLHRVTLELLSMEPEAINALVAVAGLLDAEPGNQLSLALPDSAAVGSTVTIELSGGEPFAPYEIRAGFQPRPIVTGGTLLDVGPSRVIATGALDAAGEASFDFPVPARVRGRSVALEARAFGAVTADSNLEIFTGF